MAFFEGPLGDNGQVDRTKGHDVSCSLEFGRMTKLMLYVQYLAKKIGQAGQQYAVDHWGWKEMQAYVSVILRMSVSMCHADFAKLVV